MLGVPLTEKRNALRSYSSQMKDSRLGDTASENNLFDVLEKIRAL